MVQRKAFNKFLGCPTETRIRGGRAGGGEAEAEAGGDIMKMLKKKKPNYMKPTTSSDARTVAQVTTTSLAKPISPSPVRPCKIKPTKATCSSILKDSKFPKALELHPGGTEAQGTSAMRVCPYNYCSLNGHWHEPLPPLRSVMSARRKLLSTQKSFKHKGQPLYKVKGLVKDEEVVDDDFFVEIYAKVKESQDAELDIYTEKNTHKQFENKDGYYSDMYLGDDLEQKSELSVEDIGSMLSLLEFVDCDLTIESKEENQPCLVPEGIKPVIIPTTITSDINSGGEEGPDPDYKFDCSDYKDDVLSPKSLLSPETEFVADELPFEPSSNLGMKSEEDTEQLTDVDELPFEPSSNLGKKSEEDTEQLTNVHENIDQAIELAMLQTEPNLDDEFLNYEISSHGTEEEDMDDQLIKEPTINPDGDSNYGIDDVFPLSDNESTEPMDNNNATAKINQLVTETADEPKLRLRIIRKTTTEEEEQMKGFNPRSPRFLEIEADPEAEKVDLRHQMTDERKNAEEWMIDYALQRALSNLEPARKKKVSLLVKAFETVKPLSAREEPPQYATSGFTHSRIIQSCS